jgi:hypothetical protein
MFALLAIRFATQLLGYLLLKLIPMKLSALICHLRELCATMASSTVAPSGIHGSSAYGWMFFFLTARVAGFSLSPPLVLSNARASFALNGYCRTDC